MIELWTLVILILVCIAWIRYHREEAFTNAAVADDIYLHACPTGFTSFYQADGTTLCCEGEIIAKKCAGTRQCALNGTGSGEIPSCASMIQAVYTEKGKDYCPAAMTTYFEDGKGKKGCTDGPRNATLTGPKTQTQPTCWIYGSAEENATAKDSCANQKEMESFPCFGKDCTKELVAVSADKPVKIAVNFTDDSGMHRMAYTRASLQRYLDAANPKWRDQGMDLQKNISVAEVAKAYYVDHTMTQADVQL
jgi:hypothetical protein